MSAPTPLTRHVTRLYRSADAATRLEGSEWYNEAYETAHALAASTGHSLSTAVGVIAATSPLNSWKANVALAERILTTGDTSKGYLTVGLQHARRILDGVDPLDTLKSQKVTNFYRAILTRGRDGVCIDRHAWDIATNTRHANNGRPSISGRRYDLAADCYRRAADILSAEHGTPISAAEVQATTWLIWRRMHWAPGAYDHTRED